MRNADGFKFSFGYVRKQRARRTCTVGLSKFAMSLTGHARYWYHCRVAREPAINANTYWTIWCSELTGHGSPLPGTAQVYQHAYGFAMSATGHARY